MRKDIRIWSSLRLEECKVEIQLQIICVHEYIEIKHGPEYKIYVFIDGINAQFLYYKLLD